MDTERAEAAELAGVAVEHGAAQREIADGVRRNHWLHGRLPGGLGQQGLGERDLVAGRGPGGVRGQRRGDGQPALVAGD